MHAAELAHLADLALEVFEIEPFTGLDLSRQSLRLITVDLKDAGRQLIRITDGTPAESCSRKKKWPIPAIPSIRFGDSPPPLTPHGHGISFGTIC